MKDIRWKQRFQNFKKAFMLLQSYVNINSPSELERAGVIQFFEMAFELSWKLMKDYLEANGYKIRTPRQAIKQSFQSEIITDGHSWLDALQDRNMTVHTYDETLSLEMQRKIKEKYYPLLEELYIFMQNELRP